MVLHPLKPIADADSRVLILGSFPSVKSRESLFYYGHPQNRFWRVLAAVFADALPQSVEEKEALLHRHHIALWDVIARCEIEGSADASIRSAAANDIAGLLESAPIRTIFVNGKTADRLYRQMVYPTTGREAICLPSTSPANAAWTLDRLIEAWHIVKLT